MLSLSIWIYFDYTTPQNIELSLKDITPNKNTTIFSAYSSDGTISDYVISYLKRLKQISPNIIYVTDNKISKYEIRKIKPFINHIIAYRHKEYDWGSFKRGFNFLKNNPKFKSNAELILANDSTLAVIPSFKPIIDDFENKKVDFYGITANQDGIYHIQSYFMIFTPKLYTSKEFFDYLNNVTQQKDGLTVAYTYEVPFTKYFSDLGYTHATYINYDDLSYLELNDKHCYPLTMLSKHNLPLLKMRTFTNRLIVKEPRRLVFSWLKKNHYQPYRELIRHLKKIKSPYLKDNYQNDN